MPRPRIISHVVASVVLLGLGAGTSRAALLAEIGINAEPAFDGSPPSTNSALYRFDVASQTPTLVVAEWGRQVTAGDIGATFEADPEMVDTFARALARPTAEVTIQVHRISYGRTLDQLQSVGWGECCGRATFRKFVPDISKIPVNRLTMTIDSFSFERFGENGSIGGGHTIRIYGVPEPSALVLFIAGSLAGHSFMRS